MALSTDQYGYLIDPLVPITDATGKTVKDGFLRVYIAGSSTPVITYRNYDGTANEKTIELDNSGRCKYPVIVSKSLAYKVVVYDAEHSQENPIITVDKMFAIGASVTVGADATVVTGLNGFRTKPDGFVDASVIGTDGYVALDHTLVDDDLDTDAKATAVEEERYIPLLNEDVNDPDSKITLKRLRQWANRPTQVVIEPSDFIGTGMSNDEWAAAVAAIEGDKTAVVKWTESGASRVAFSVRYEEGVGIVFVSENGGYVTEYVVAAASGAHSVTTNVYELAGSHSIAKFTVTQTDVNTYVYPNESDVRAAITNYDTVILRLAPLGGGFTNYVLDHQAVAVGIRTTYTWVREDGSRVITLEGSGSPVAWTWSESIVPDSKIIYGSLQNAISDNANLKIGDYFETNGFHSAGDGGAARYLVSDTGTANGMDIVQLATGKLAVLQVDDGTATPEQFGYNRWNQDDLTPVMNRMQSVKVRNIVLSPLESGDSFPYLIKTTFTPNPSIRISSRFDFNTGASGRIWFEPSSYGTDHTVMFQLTNRGFGIKDVVLMNRPWFTEGNKHNCVCFRMAINGNNNMWYEFESLAIQGFDEGVLHENVTGQDNSGLIWHCSFKRLQMALNNINIHLRNVNYLTKFENCFITCDDSGARSIVLEETFSTEFERCNFGIYNPATTIVDFKDYIVTGKAVDRRFTQAKFTNCNFEIESNDSHPLPTSNKGFFMRFGDHDEFNVELDNCCFIITPLTRSNVYGCRPIQLGAKTRMKITNTSGPYDDVNYAGNEFYGWDYCKRMFDETKPPKKEVGSLIIQHCVGIIPPPNNQWGSAYLPAFKTDEMTCPQSDDNTDFLTNYPDARDGVLLLNLDKANIETKIGNSIIQVTAPASGKIRIGDRIYDYVTIDGRKWITTNLCLWTMGTRQWHYQDHDEYGFYYQVQSFSEIDAILPTGWRRPTNTDFESLISQGYAALQATGQTAFPSATNSSGFSALPSQRWKKPNTTHTFTNCFLWGRDQGNGYSALRITSTAASIAGWSYSDINSTSDPVYVPMRVCADA